MNKYTAVLFVSLLLTACGGGNDSVVSIPAAKSTPIIVTIGDSETAGAVSTLTGFANIPEASYPARLQGLLGSKAVVHNLGVNSKNLLEVIEEQLPKAISLKPSILIISTTLNDAGDNLDKSMLIVKYTEIKKLLPNTVVILLTPLKPHVSITNLQDYKDNLYKTESLGILVFDVEAKSDKDWYCGHEDFHPCEYGYREMARVVQEYLLVNNLI